MEWIGKLLWEPGLEKEPFPPIGEGCEIEEEGPEEDTTRGNEVGGAEFNTGIGVVTGAAFGVL